MLSRTRFSWALSLVVCAAACSDDAAPAGVASPPDRDARERTPRSAECDDADPSRCGLPWPSNVYTVRDPAAATGLRVNVTARAIVQGDDAREVNRADGFSRVNPIVTAFPADLDPASLGDGTTGAVRLIQSTPGEGFGTSIPLRYRLVEGDGVAPETLVVAYPRRPMRAATDYVVAVLDALRPREGGAALVASDAARVALALKAPATEAEARLRAYHAPARAALAQAGVDRARVLRVWDFTTRSAGQPTRTLNAMRARLFAALADDAVTVVVDVARPIASGPAALEVRGHLANVPDFIDADGRVARAADGSPRVADGDEGVHDVPFRVLVPRGAGGYRVAMWGHGAGGDVNDSSFDDEITGGGAAKVNILFAGWNGTELLSSFARFNHLLVGVERSTAGLTQSAADGQLLFRAAVGDEAGAHAVLGDALAAPMIGGVANPAAGRRPTADGAIWTGGSLGGTMGLVYTASEPRMTAAVLNVPGAGWSHYITGSNLYTAVRLLLLSTYRSDVDVFAAIAMSQLNFDDVDGAVWFDTSAPRPMLLQESMGDPVLPNIGSEVAASAVGAAQVGAVLAPVSGAALASEVTGARSAITQFRVPSGVTDPLSVHGFGARETPAGVAAREQIVAFIASVWAGSPRVTVPPSCLRNTPAGSCDFSASR